MLCMACLGVVFGDCCVLHVFGYKITIIFSASKLFQHLFSLRISKEVIFALFYALQLILVVLLWRTCKKILIFADITR